MYRPLIIMLLAVVICAGCGKKASEENIDQYDF